MALQPLRTTCQPREDVLEGGLSDNHFAAQLDKIVRAPEEYPVYGNPQEFFSITYPTAGLRTLLNKTFARVSGAKGPWGENGVLRPTTSFGGGKTHGLTAVYHLATGARPAGLEEFMEPDLLPNGPVQIAALVGDALDPVAGVDTNGIRSFTLWGEMAAHLGPQAWAVLEANDVQRAAPGTQTMKEAFGGQPTIVIIDEIAKYLRQVTSAGSEDVRRMARAVPVFLNNLFEVASDPSNQVSVIITLASSSNAYGQETDEINEALDAATGALADALAEANDVLARSVQPSAVIQPADDSEIGEILKRRLFARIDPAAAQAAGDAYRALYEDLASRGEQLAGGAEQPATYGEQVTRYYPFHPELVRVLDKRLGAIHQFQRARGALKLLAEVVSYIYKDRDDIGIINVADIDYSDAPVANHLTDGIDRPQFKSVLQADLAGPSSHAAAVDAEIFGGKRYATLVARTVFTHSLELAVTAGASRNDWILGTLCPDEDPAIYEKALTESEDRFWHLSYDGARWRFDIEPNVNAIIESEKRNIQNTRVAAEVDRMIRDIAFKNDGGATTIVFPAGPSDIPDEPSLRIAVIHHDVLSVTAKDADNPPAMIAEMMDRTGSSGAPRKYRNSLVFAVADEARVDELKERVRAFIATGVLAADHTRLAQFSEDIRRKVKQANDRAVLEARIAVGRCYKHIYWPTKDAAHSNLRQRELPTEEQGNPGTATAAILALLIEEGKIRTEPMGAAYLASKAWPESSPMISTKDLSDAFWADHSVAMVRDITHIRAAILAGVKNDNWVYWDSATGKTSTAANLAGLSIEFRADAYVLTLEEANKQALIVRKPTQTDLRSVFVGPVMTGTDIRGRLERQCGGEPTKGDVLDVLATAVQAGEYRWIVVTDTEPAKDVRALSPSVVKDRGLDSLFVMTREYADELEVVVPGRVVTSKTLTESGPGGQAVQRIIDQASDLTVSTVSRLVIKTTVDDTRGTGDLDLLVTGLGMLPKFAITVNIDLRAQFDGLSGGGLTFRGSASRTDFQTVWSNVGKTVKAASQVSGFIQVEIAFSPPAPPDGPDFRPIVAAIKGLQIEHAEITAEVSK